MSRQFDGSTSRLVFDVPAALTSYTHGTWMFMIKMLADNAWSGIVNLHNGLSTARAGIEKGDGANDNRANLAHGTNSRKNPDALTVADGWLLVLMAKATGTATPTWSIRTDGTGGSWTHGNTDGTLANATGTSTRIVVGEWQLGDHANMLAATMAIWQGTVLTNLQRESIWPGGSSGGVANILSLSPNWCVQYNQAVADGVLDLVSTGHERAADRVDTTFSTDNPSGFSYYSASAPAAPRPLIGQYSGFY